MFNTELKVKTIDSRFDLFLNVTNDILDNVNDTQHYLPGLTFFLVLYVYFIIGEGKIWKYLLISTGSGFMASILTSFFNSLRNYITLDYALQLKWFEGLFWHFHEYGYIYISYLKLKIVVSELQKKYWKYIMTSVFVYNIIVRLIISAVTIIGRKSSAASHLLGLTFLPLSLVEVAFMYLIIKTFIENNNANDVQKNIISTMLTSSLTRMFLIGLIFFLTSVVCFFYSPPLLRNIKAIVWRAKAALGLIFLLDLLFIRIDLKEKISTVHSYKFPSVNKNALIINTDNDQNSTTYTTLNRNNHSTTNFNVSRYNSSTSVSNINIYGSTNGLSQIENSNRFNSSTSIHISSPDTSEKTIMLSDVK